MTLESVTGSRTDHFSQMFPPVTAKQDLVTSEPGLDSIRDREL